MIRQLAASALALALAAGPLHAASTPSSGRLDPRIRNAVYHPDQVFVVETDLRHATTIHFGQGETFQAVIVGDTESFKVDPIPEIGNILTIKPHVAKARTNMTVVTNRRTYSFDLVENAIVGSERVCEKSLPWRRGPCSCRSRRGRSWCRTPIRPI